MKVKAYVLVVSVAAFSMSAGTKESRSIEGLNPGDLAPRIKFLDDSNELNFQSNSESYTLLNFWAAYNAESRARNVQLSNEVNKLDSSKIVMLSVSLDKNESIFRETLRLDGLKEDMQLHESVVDMSDLMRKYNQNKGFGSFLINGEGIIVATNVTPEILTKELNLN